jgi:uncharacterized protein YndB with AHSA1/START domain
MPNAVDVERTIAAPPQRVYELVSDLPRMGEWSPENRGGRWTRGATTATVGARFRGRNRRGWRRWSTTVTITEAQPGETFAFDVSAGPFAVAEWRFRLRPAGDAGADTTITQSFVDRRGRLITWLGLLATGVRDRTAHNRATMAQTLARLAAVAEGDGSG